MQTAQLSLTTHKDPDGIAAPPSLLFAFDDLQPFSNRIVAEVRRSPVEARLRKVQKMCELVEPNMIAVGCFIEAPVQRRHRQDHDSPRIRNAGSVSSAELVEQSTSEMA